LFLLVRDADGRARAGVAVEEVRTRAMPGHVVLRVRRFGGGLPSEVQRAVLEAITSLARNRPRVLRLQLILFSRDGREAMTATLREHGFREVRPPSVYQHTLAIDLRPSEEEIFASLGKSSRKRIRETMKMGLRAIVIDDPVYADRIRELQLEALRRTGGHTPSDDWRGILKMSKENPNLSRVLGLFHGEDTAPENMGAFGWVCNNGDHGEYRAAGSKSRGEVRIPFGYLLVWEMIRWAKESGVAWFDMGGVTLAGKNGTALEGISEFKRFFSQELIEVGAEWVFEPYPVRARIANVVSNGASQVRSWMGK
jgi:hypothetical protein